MTKKVAILQSNYIPWKGYFDIINSVDEFIIYDDVQYTVDDWRNRNKIKTKQGIQWISIPVVKKGRLEKKISEIKVADTRWAKKHWGTLTNAYAKTPHFKDYAYIIENLYLNKAAELEYLSDINYLFISEINSMLGISTTIRWSSDFVLKGDRSERLLNICKETNADHYVSGRAASGYLDGKIFQDANIDIEWVDYSNYPEYEQLHECFTHEVSILDLLFNTGPNVRQYMKSF